MANSLQQINVELELRRRLDTANTVIGFVSPITKELTKAIVRVAGEWMETDDEPTVYLAEKLEPIVTTNKRFIGLIGGRGSSKSLGIGDIRLVKAKDDDEKTYCLREFQSSIKNSVMSLLKEEIKRLEMSGFEIMDKTIRRDEEDMFQFAGIARNISSIKSSHGFQCFFVEEAQFLSQESLDALTPTARNKPNKGLPMSPEEIEQAEELSGVSMVFVANPESSEDPFSQRFIVPYQDQLDAHGYYEDDLHLIIVVNYHDNPWFDESGLEKERVWSKSHMSRAMYDHIWLGAFNDNVENSLIMGEWFDACIDAHIKLGWDNIGAKIGSHDPSDEGADSKGYALRHGSVIESVLEMEDGNVNEGGHWATDNAKADGVDFFTFDADGMGVALSEQVSRDLMETGIRIAMFRGSEGVDNPESIYAPATYAQIANQKKNKEVCRNKREQYYVDFRDRCYRTYRAVVHGEHQDPDKCISFSSDIKLMKKLRAEACRMPIKPHGGGLIALYTKEEMKSKFGFKSPNLIDSVVMSLRYISIDNPKPYIPAPLKAGGSGRAGRGQRG